MVDFAGFKMPIQYPDGIVSEHLAVRKSAGLFDVSHMGRFLFAGPNVLVFLDNVLTNHAAALAPCSAQYTIIADNNGGVIDDAYLYCLEDQNYMLVVNASNKDKVASHLAAQLKSYKGVEFADVSNDIAMISIQGPDSESILNQLFAGALPSAGRNSLSITTFDNTQIFMSRTGYAGEQLGFELFVASGSASVLWQKLKQLGAKPIGLGARDTLRLEASLPLYGHELGTDIDSNPIPVFAIPQARFAVSFVPAKGPYIGSDPLKKQNQTGCPKMIRPLAVLDKGIVRLPTKLFLDGKQVGYVTSGTMIPYWLTDDPDKHAMRAIALAYIDSVIDYDTVLQADVRGKMINVKVVKNNITRHDTYVSAKLHF